jgi:hypothetical protein
VTQKEIEEKLVGAIHKMYICKVCGRAIIRGMCSYGCIHYNEYPSERPKDSAFKAIYKFDRVEEV